MLWANLPFMFLYARDLKNCGYRYSDVFRVCALNLMLLPVVTAGVIKQAEQIFTGRKTPFKRTPKVKDRTGAPAMYYLFEMLLTGYYGYRMGSYFGHEMWTQMVFAGFNYALLTYAMVRYIGLDAIAEDLTGSARHALKKIRLPSITPQTALSASEGKLAA